MNIIKNKCVPDIDSGLHSIFLTGVEAMLECKNKHICTPLSSRAKTRLSLLALSSYNIWSNGATSFA